MHSYTPAEDTQFYSLEFKIPVLVLKSKLGVAPKYIMDHIRSTLSATTCTHQQLRFSDRQALFVPQVRIARSLATIGPSLWNALLFA